MTRPPRWLAGVPLLLYAMALAAADGVAPVRIDGRIAPASGVVVPADASWIVELRDDATEKLLAQQRQTLPVQAWPVTFTLRVDAARLYPGRAYSVRAGVLAQGRIGWLSPAQPLPLGPASVDVGLLSLSPYRFPGAFSRTLRCGDRDVTLGHVGNQLRLSVGSEAFDLDRSGAASAQRFERPGDATTFVVIGEHAATVSVHGQVFEACVNRGAAPPGARPASR